MAWHISHMSPMYILLLIIMLQHRELARELRTDVLPLLQAKGIKSFLVSLFTNSHSCSLLVLATDLRGVTGKLLLARHLALHCV